MTETRPCGFALAEHKLRSIAYPKSNSRILAIINTMEKMMQYQIGVIGATGYIGTPYRREIRESSADTRVIALCARRRDRLERAAEEDGATLITDKWQDIVNHPEVNLVLVLTPDALHYEPVLACAEAGKHVLCEKPIGKNVDEAHKMWAAATKAGIASYVPFWTRYVPAIRRAKELYEQGKLGEIQSIIYRWHNPRPLAMPFTWRDDASLSSAGSIADVGSHAYDTLRFILGQEAKRVLTHAQVVMPPKPQTGEVDLAEAISFGEEHSTSDAAPDAKTRAAANTANQRKGSAPDYAQIAVEFESGAVGSILLSHASYIRKGFAPELELHGTKASVSVDRIRNELHFADSTEPARAFESLDDGVCNRFENHVFPAFEQRINGQPTEHPDLYDGWRVQVFTDAALASSQRGTWVELQEFDADH
jgi:predicted dehydrogenase